MLRITLRMTLLMLAIVAIVGCVNDESKSPAIPAQSVVTAPPTTAPSEYKIELFVNNQLSSTILMSDISALPQRSIAESESEMGPTVASVLALAGIVRYRQIQVVGLSPGRKSASQITLVRDKVTDNVILDITGRGTTKLAGSDIPSSEWVLDVSRIYVEQGEAQERSGAYSFEVFHKGESKGTLTADDIKGLPETTLAVQGTQTGPTLITVLNSVDVGEFSAVVIKGLAPGRRLASELTLTRQEVTDEVILSITGQGTVKLTSTAFPREKWVIDVSTIEAD